MLRIQSGIARGRLLVGLHAGVDVRPILARIRKSLFDILRPRLAGSFFLDLFAGTGAVGLEALSNGAARAVFVDGNRRCCRAIEGNAARLGFADQAEVHCGDITKSLAWLKGRPFDLVFLGPPYKDAEKSPLALTIATLMRVEEAGLLAPGGWVIAQHHKKEPVDDVSGKWEMFRRNYYGDSVLSFFQFKG
ncbi:MAG TPA: 16S rRNA (guanine(966)-N(2))-methyltransferase RsmD [Elusimicrobiota bacterium]|nr:16S rRNA (guanine(966)-N(2))-methyltransferase RsmD [Elusimicrobiota bacterium]